MQQSQPMYQAGYDPGAIIQNIHVEMRSPHVDIWCVYGYLVCFLSQFLLMPLAYSQHRDVAHDA